MNEESSYKISVNLIKDELDFLDTINHNRSEAMRILIKKARQPKNNREWIRQILMNISIGFISLALFYIWASIISWLFIILAIIIFSYEVFDIICMYKTKKISKGVTFPEIYT